MENRDELVQQVNLFLYVKNKSSWDDDHKIACSMLVKEQGLEIGQGEKSCDLERWTPTLFFSGDVLRSALQLTERLDQANSKAITCDSVISVSPGSSLAQLRSMYS